MHATISNEFLTDSLHFVNLFKSLQRCIIICIDGKHCVHVRKVRGSASTWLIRRYIELQIVNYTVFYYVDYGNVMQELYNITLELTLNSILAGWSGDFTEASG